MQKTIQFTAEKRSKPFRCYQFCVFSRSLIRFISAQMQTVTNHRCVISETLSTFFDQLILLPFSFNNILNNSVSHQIFIPKPN